MISRLGVVLLAIVFMVHAAPMAVSASSDQLGRIGDVPIIDTLDAATLAPGRHHFYFKAGWHNSGVPIYVPVVVLKGAKPGKRLLLAAAVHGDELNGIGVVHRLLDQLDPLAISGTLVTVPGLNQPGMSANNRRFPTSSGGGAMVDLNRKFPGTRDEGGSATGLYLGKLWSGLIRPNTDLAIDLHTMTRGAAYPLFVFADFTNGTAKQMAFLLGPDMIKNDPGQTGTLETSLLKAGVPAVTFEVGGAKVFNAVLITRAVAGIQNVMRAQGMLAGKVNEPKKPIVGSSYTNVYTNQGGVAVVHVKLKDRVVRGQHVATLYDPFGVELERYSAPHDGWVLAVATDPLREAGTMLVRIMQ